MQEENWNLYYDNVKTRCHKLIDYGIWNGMDSNKLNGWLKNFKTDQEKFLAACILDTLSYKSQDQVISLLYDLLTRDLNNLFRSESKIINKLSNPLLLLQDKWADPGFRIVSAVKGEDPPSKSGNLMNNHIVNHLDVCNKWTINPNTIEKAIANGVKNFVLIDDIVCTGEQICGTILEWNLQNYEGVQFFIAVCVAHETGIMKLKTDFPKIPISYAEKLKLNGSFFENFDIGHSDYADKDDAINHYKEFLKENGVKNRKILGFGDLGLVYGFAHNVPNASLPVLYYECENFNSLLKKR